MLAAAEDHVERCEREPEATGELNVEAAPQVIAAAHGVGARSSSSSRANTSSTLRRGRSTEPDQRVWSSEGAPRGGCARRAPPPHLPHLRRLRFGRRRARTLSASSCGPCARAGSSWSARTSSLRRPTRRTSRAVAALIDSGHRDTYHVVGPRPVTRVEFTRLTTGAFGLPAWLLRLRPTASWASSRAVPPTPVCGTTSCRGCWAAVAPARGRAADNGRQRTAYDLTSFFASLSEAGRVGSSCCTLAQRRFFDQRQ